jgi:hypothetical protein
MKKKIVKKPIKKPKKKKKTVNFFLWGGTILLLLVIAVYFVLKIPEGKSKNRKHVDIEAENINVIQCQKNPYFPQLHSMQPPYAFDLRQGIGNLGMKVIEYNTGKSLKLPGWEKFGALGLYTVDDEGNLYANPIPYVSMDRDYLARQNIIVKVDGQSGEMTKFLEVGSQNPPTLKNPYGIMGLIYDCSTNSLYASSIAGSTYENESGKIVQINKNTKEILDEINGFDALGLCIFSVIDVKRLYMGGARKPVVYSVGIKKDGSFENDIREEFSHLELTNGSYKKAHRILIDKDVMIVKSLEFSYTLIAATGEMRTEYTYRYNLNKGKWDFIEMNYVK